MLSLSFLSVCSFASLLALSDAAIDADDLVADICDPFYSPYYAPTGTGEPMASCQWDMSLIDANAASMKKATGVGVRIGVLDSGVDYTHPDLAANVDVSVSCSFIYDDTPTAIPEDIGNGDCSNKDAALDFSGHGTHVASIIASPGK